MTTADLPAEAEGGLDEPEELQPDQGSLALASDRDDHGRADWEKAAADLLRKAKRLGDDDPDDAVWEKLALTTLDGITVTPLGTRELLDDLQTSGRPQRAGDWDIRTQPQDNEQALSDLDTGATSLWIDAATDLAALLAGVLLDMAPVVLQGTSPERARTFLDLLGDSAPAAGTNLGADPLGDDLVEIAELAREAGALAAVVDATATHDQGASDVQELAYGLAVGAAYLRTLTEAGIPMDEALHLVEFRYAATDEQFLTLAKLRAARRCWARVAELSDASPDAARQRQHAVTSAPMMSKYDPWVNMLRTTVAAFAAGTGGADAVTVLPFDGPLGAPDASGRRIARNISLLLISESHAARVADPAGGAYAVEKLTDDLAGAAWKEFGRIEEDGGIRAVLDDGSLRARIDEVAARRDSEIAHRTRPLTGVSEFPHLGESLPERQPDGPDQVRRYGSQFEALRDDPVNEAVFLATMGTVSSHTARASFVTNLLAAGGVAVEGAGPTEKAEDVLEEYDGQRVVCLAGTDAAYDEWGAELVASLREAGAAWVILVGSTGDLEVADSCAQGVDAIEFLTRTREKLP